MVIQASPGYYIVYGRSSTFKGGDRSSDKHQALNPMVSSISFPESLRYEIEKVTTCENLYPNIEYDKQLAEGSVKFKCNFRDPIAQAMFYTYKGVPGTWTGSSDTMTFSFTNLNDQDKNIWLQIHYHDQSGSSNHLDIFLDGGEMVSYKLSGSKGEAVYEEFEIKFVEINIATDTDSTGAYACDIDNGFDDGSFDQTGVAEISTIVAVAAASITDGKYFKLWKADGAGGWTAYYVWFDKVGDSSGDPAPTGYTEIRCDISGDTTAQEVSDCITAAITAISGLTAANGSGTLTTVTVTNDNTGDIKDIVDVDSGLTLAVTTQGVTGLDGGWSLWDGAYTSTKCVMTVDCTITFGGVAISGVDIQSFVLEAAFPRERYWDISSLTAKGTYMQPRGAYKMTVEGVITSGHVNFAEPSTLIASKTQGTVKLQWGTTKYIQFTNGRTENASAGEIKAGEPLKASFELVGGADAALSTVWTASEATDPSDHIEHTAT